MGKRTKQYDRLRLSTAQHKRVMLVALLLVVLCFVQGYRMRASFRTMRAFRGFRRKKTR